MTDQIEIDRVYNFVIDNLGFGPLSHEEVSEIYKDGRPCSHLLEPCLVKWFPALTHIKGCKGYDHIDQSGQKYDAKNFTRSGGLRFMPSNQIGAGRKLNLNEVEKKSRDLVYICCDIVDFPKVRVVFKTGEDLLKRYPSASVALSKREELFGD